MKQALTFLTLLCSLTISRAADEPPTNAAKDNGAARRPNLVFVFSDQQSWDMMGACGNTNIVTPNFDRLASEWVRFNHCISSAPVCTPYRGMLLSGQHPLRNVAPENDLQMRPGNGQYFGEVLRDAGYRTGYYGKWHLYGGNRDRPIPPGPYRYGFDHEFLANNCTVDFSPETSYFRDDDGKKLYGDPQHKEIQEQLHAETRKWIAQYQDVGLPCRRILELNKPNKEGSRQ